MRFSAPAPPLATLTGHAGLVAAVAFRPDGARLATASYDGTARPWDPQRWVSPRPEVVCDAVNRDLSKEEWNVYLPTEPYKQTCSSK
jgi:WD40 repeat protein